MKRKLLILLLMILTLVACRTQPQQQEITYTDEFPYLPKHPSMIPQEFIKGEEGDFDQAFYVVEGVSYDNLLTEYRDILLNDGWKVVKNSRPHSMNVEKANYEAVFIVQETNSAHVGLVVMSREYVEE